ncbi:MAG: hypothetical protein C0621_00155 [Desulfuromonas sp.]|nr:MAG: hypothetical protein C0621_00155 [Desulfuromonas sp.]
MNDWDWKLIYGVFKDILLLAALLYTWWSNRQKVTRNKIKALEDKVNAGLSVSAHEGIEEKRTKTCQQHQARTGELERALDKINVEIEHLPSQDDIARIHARMDGIGDGVNTIVGEMKATRRQVDLVLEEMMRRDKR